MEPVPAAVAATAPFKVRMFRLLWTATLVSNVGSWMENVGEGWLMTSLSSSPLVVSLVQVANTLPMLLLSLPAGAMADVLNRRKLLILTQSWLMLCAATLALVTYMGIVSPIMLLGITALMGVGSALNQPAWRAITSDLVPKELLPQAISLNGVAVNSSRIIGPAIGGLLIAALGTQAVFALNALSYIGVIYVLVQWPYKPSESKLPPEHLASAMVAGIRYVVHSPAILRVLGITLCCFPFSSGIFALLPLVARHELGQQALGYGLLLGGLGIGAIVGGVSLARLRSRYTLNTLVRFGFIGSAFMLIGVGLAGRLAAPWGMVMAFSVLTLGGIAWVNILSNLQIVVQTSVPGWVRGRALSVYLLVFFASQTVGSLTWGWVAAQQGVSVALLLAGCGLLAGSFVIRQLPLPDSRRTPDFTPMPFTPRTDIDFDPSDEDYSESAVMVMIEYRIDISKKNAFLTAMYRLRHMRQAEGAIDWWVYEDLQDPARQVEVFTVRSWLDFQRQRSRATVSYRRLVLLVRSFHTGPEKPRVTYLLDERRRG